MFFFIKKNRHSNVLHGIVNSPDAQNASWLPGCGWSHIAVKHSTGGGKSQGETCFLFGKPVISIKNTNPVSRTGIWAVSLVSDPVLILADHCIKMFFQSGAAENIAFHVNHFYRAAPFTQQMPDIEPVFTRRKERGKIEIWKKKDGSRTLAT
ncbi:MAG: hypothetical protein HFG23_09905 [Anaerotruncus sp.]|nr:hypothetical protein [Anaerotruncus sp.]